MPCICSAALIVSVSVKCAPSHLHFERLSSRPVVRMPVNTNPGLDFKPGFFFLLSKVLSRTIFSILYRVSNNQIVGKENYTEFAFKAVISEFKFRTNPGLS